MTQKSDLLMLIDGNHLAHRCRHVFSLSYRGVDVSVTYGFLKVLRSLMDKFKPYAVMVCWDGGIPDYRRQLLPQYKANRHADDDELSWENFRRQLDQLSDRALPIMGIVSVRKKGAEGDDLLYHATRISTTDNLVVSGDADLIQVLNSRTKMYMPHKNIVIGVEDVEHIYGVSLDNYIHWKAIQGDSSDNIPGVPGIGDKTATKLFQEYGCLTNITNAAAGVYPEKKLTGKIASNIQEFGLDKIAVNVRVMTLFRDLTGAKVAIRNAVLDYNPCSPNLVKNYFMANGFVSLLDWVGSLNRLQHPRISARARYPIVAAARTPV